MIASLLLGPVLFTPGFLLTYDMVWVPDLALRGDFFGLGSGIPRAVPSDAVVAVLDEVVPGMVLQKLFLLVPILAGGVGIQRWVDDTRVTLGGSAAAAFYLWNPYVVERLAIGHWPMLVCYGLLPWVARAVLESRSSGRVSPWLLVLLPLASLNASAGIAAAVVVIAFAVPGVKGALLARLGGAVVVANLPWLVAGLSKVDVVRHASTAAGTFASSGEGPLPAPLATLTLGGIWNAEVVPTSRTTFLAWVSLVLLLVAVAGGWRQVTRHSGAGWWLCAGVGWLVAIVSWGFPDLIDALAASVPGAAILRDGSRLLLLLAPVLALCVGAAVDRLVRRAGEAAPVIGACAVMLPIAVMPDAAWGSLGDLDPVDYPRSYVAMQQAVQEVHEEGDVLVLPFTAYRAPDWNGFRKVFDPVGRYQDEDYLASDSLAVSGRQLGGEDPRGRRVLEALDLPTPEQRSSALAQLGVGVVVTDLETAALPGQVEYVAELAAEQTTAVDGFSVDVLADASESPESRWRAAALAGGWLSYAGLLVLGLANVVRRVGMNATARAHLRYTRRRTLGGK